jgi:hypothetical protein
MARKPQHLSSCELLDRIGLSEDNPIPLLKDEPLDLVLGVVWDRDPGRGEFAAFHFV